MTPIGSKNWKTEVLNRFMLEIHPGMAKIILFLCCIHDLI